MVESSALLKRRSPKGYRGFESLPHRQCIFDFRFLIFDFWRARSLPRRSVGEGGFDWRGALRAKVIPPLRDHSPEPKRSFG